ncbi:hypothetical protein MVES1_003489 [Malassezia vespertilionis]|uniref:uncharacterized protein n=1 Tax=Malassezia vespertilionis TaxID=2020962 RepID=UPI0024B0610E|nr:uncharacterized protein MVES1_003489 [Malassezia vespertilionis]WFD08119.1 hypothetical protein MVES1_003489 [Malassezia vespertilionis]
MTVPLYVQANVDGAVLLQSIRASEYVREVASGEDAPQDSALWTLVDHAPAHGQPVVGSQAAVEHAARLDSPPWSKRVLVLADEQDSVLLVALEKEKIVDTLRVVPRSVLEVVRFGMSDRGGECGCRDEEIGAGR